VEELSRTARGIGRIKVPTIRLIVIYHKGPLSAMQIAMIHKTLRLCTNDRVPHFPNGTELRVAKASSGWLGQSRFAGSSGTDTIQQQACTSSPRNLSLRLYFCGATFTGFCRSDSYTPPFIGPDGYPVEPPTPSWPTRKSRSPP
jgi:hypothetical protein